MLVLTLLMLVACTPLSTKPFNPQKSKTTEEIVQAQLRAALPAGMKAPYSGMDCVKYVEYQIAECEVTLRCSSWRYRQLKRDWMRAKMMFNSRCYYSKDHIDQISRSRPGL